MPAIQLTDEMKVLGHAMGAAGARFEENPTPINRAEYLHAIRRVVEHQFAGKPRAVRFLMDVHIAQLDELEAQMVARPEQHEAAE